MKSIVLISIVFAVFAACSLARSTEDDPCCQVPQTIPCFAPCSHPIDGTTSKTPVNSADAPEENPEDQPPFPFAFAYPG